MSRNNCTGSAIVVKKRIKQWEDLMRKYSEKHKETCKFSEIRPSRLKEFPTGSSYDGEFGLFGMTGYGEYTFTNGVVYRGHFEDGMFHGHGELIYSEGLETDSVIRGAWKKGVLTQREILFDGNLEYDEHDWKYCKLPDRRYAVEFENDLLPAGKSNLTPHDPPREIPPGFYDTGHGLYHDETQSVHYYERILDVIRNPSNRERKWIYETCRKKPLGAVGPRPDCYETWTAPVPEPAPLPDPIVGIKKMTKSPSVFEHDYENRARPDFYDPSSSEYLQSAPQRKFQTLRNFLN